MCWNIFIVNTVPMDLKIENTFYISQISLYVKFVILSDSYKVIYLMNF